MLSFQVEEHAKSEEAKCELQAAKAEECGDIEKAKHMQVLIAIHQCKAVILS